MSNEIIMLKPIFKERIWGGKKLKSVFNYDITKDCIGECWGISAHKEGSSIISSGIYQNQTLRWLYQNHRELFGNIKDDEFPLLTKIIDANEDLSVQVHPDDKLAKEYNDLGKTECWYIIDCEKDARIIYGHNAITKEEFVDYIKNDKWDQLLKIKPIQPGDFIFVPAGKIHAISKGTLVLETQQSSNLTFRLYDYNRKDNNGNKRELHIEDAIKASIIPDVDTEIQTKVEMIGNNEITKFIKSKYFTVERWKIHENYVRSNKLFMLLTIIEGIGEANGLKFKKGDHFLITKEAKEVSINGNFEAIVSYL